ncbi:hypothetical protein CWI84_01900 [Idiomarina tyrosinivorans]|uniref:BON domain-containing protein n=1 Tax=Idiomarina tyrosinivorans TaxID=1445662 RepID=A0A432ZUG2_9GAMM|nr:BON domain-containing protein [Idiomarina tyrosinivorans]RUO81533.1 hypothetical protein CWI84_01900 [Idiomarina tyrosinivorans]
MKQHKWMISSTAMALSLLILGGCSEASRDTAQDKTEQAMESAKETASDIADATQEKMQQAGEYVDDAVLTTRVKAALIEDDNLSDSNINVETVNGTVMLTGTVKQEADIDTAENLASNVEGVKDVETDIQVEGE